MRGRYDAEPADEEDSAGSSQSGSENDFACASQAETVRAIQAVLEDRERYLKSKNIADTRYVLTNDERWELVASLRLEVAQMACWVQAPSVWHGHLPRAP